jgi:hypothetical protein
VGGFEGNPEKVFSEENWHAGESGECYQHQSTYFSEGSMSMRLHATLGSVPFCDPVPDAYLYQTVEVPFDIYAQTTMVVRGKRLVAPSESRCCYPVTDPDDVLYLQMKDSGGSDLGAALEIVNGGATVGSWIAFEQDVTSEVNLPAHAGDEIQVYFDVVPAHGVDDLDCTFFYLDDLECEVCTEWPIPDHVPGMADITGRAQVLVGGIPQRLHGVDVWAYSQGGEVYHTVTIQEGSYGFYNIPPGTYTVYSEIWMVGSGFYFDTKTVSVEADESMGGLNLLLVAP